MPAKTAYQCLMSMPNLGDYVGKWIAIVGDKVIASGNDGKKVFQEARKKYPKREPLIMKVPADRVMLL